jgi:hypothetical protein
MIMNRLIIRHGCGRRQPWPISRCYPVIGKKILRKSTEKLGKAVEIRSGYLLDASLELYRYTSLLVISQVTNFGYTNAS